MLKICFICSEDFNCPLAALLQQQNGQSNGLYLWQEFSGSSPKRRRAEDKDEGIGSPDIWEEEKADDLRREMIELRQQLDKERSVRMMLEEQVTNELFIRQSCYCWSYDYSATWPAHTNTLLHKRPEKTLICYPFC